MGVDGCCICQLFSGQSHQIMADLENSLSKYIEGICQQQIVGLVDTAGLRVFDRDYPEVNLITRNKFKGLLQPDAGPKINILANQTCGSIPLRAPLSPCKAILTMKLVQSIA